MKTIIIILGAIATVAFLVATAAAIVGALKERSHDT